MSALEFVGAVCAEDEFELEKDGIHVATSEEKIFLEKIVIVLQPHFRELRRIPGQVRRKCASGFAESASSVKSRILHVQVIAANPGDPALLETPDDLRIHAPVVKRFRDRK